MSLDPVTYRAFQDELTKLGSVSSVVGRLGGAGKRVGQWIGKGWNDPIGQGKIVSTWKKGKPVENSWRWMGQGKYRQYMPIGGKSITVGLTGLAVPGVLKKEDPYGMGRSRAERSTDLGAATVGGLAGTGALMSLPWKGWKGTRALAGGVGGAMLAARLATLPWRRKRKAQQAEAVRNAPPAPEEPSYPQNPAGLRELEQW